MSTTEFVGDSDGRLQGLKGVSVMPAQENGRMTFKPVPGSEFTLECELVLLAMGFTGRSEAPSTSSA